MEVQDEVNTSKTEHSEKDGDISTIKFQTEQEKIEYVNNLFLTHEEKKRARTEFNIMDTGRSGMIDFQEIKEILSRLGYDLDEDEHFRVMDSLPNTSNPKINLELFLRIYEEVMRIRSLHDEE